MACNFNIKVVEQNDFTICIPLKKRTFVASTPIDEDIDILALEDLSVKIGGAVFPATRDVAGVMVDVSRDALARGTYDVVLTATYKGHAIKAAYFDSLTIVEWNCQSDAQQCVQGSPIMFEAGFVIYNLTDAELAALKEEYRLKIAAAQQAKEEADAAKEEYIAKGEALDDVAQQSTLTQGVSDIREDISHIDIDTSNLAKQGSNPNATLTEAQAAAVQAASDAAAAKTAAQDAKTAAEASAQESTSQSILAKVQQVIDAHVITSTSLEGWVFPSSEGITTVGKAIALANLAEEISDDSITKSNNYFMYNMINLRSLEMPNLESVGEWNFLNIPLLEELSLPKLRTKGNQSFQSMSKLKRLYLPELNSNNVNQFSYMPSLVLLDIRKAQGITVGMDNDKNLIQVILGWEGTNTNLDIRAWSPTNALNTSISSLVEPGESFANNREKLLYNIRTYIAANLPDRTGLSSLTITFSAAIKAAIQADTATSNAFTNKNWTIA